MKNKLQHFARVTVNFFILPDPPIVHVGPPNITVIEGAKILLKSEYESNPSSLNEVIW